VIPRPAAGPNLGRRRPHAARMRGFEIEAVGSVGQVRSSGDRVFASRPGSLRPKYAIHRPGPVSCMPANNMTSSQAACLPVSLQLAQQRIVTPAGLPKSRLIRWPAPGRPLRRRSDGIAKIAPICMGASKVMGHLEPTRSAPRAARRVRLRPSRSIHRPEVGRRR